MNVKKIIINNKNNDVRGNDVEDISSSFDYGGTPRVCPDPFGRTIFQFMYFPYRSQIYNVGRVLARREIPSICQPLGDFLVPSTSPSLPYMLQVDAKTLLEQHLHNRHADEDKKYNAKFDGMVTDYWSLEIDGMGTSFPGVYAHDFFTLQGGADEVWNVVKHWSWDMKKATVTYHVLTEVGEFRVRGFHHTTPYVMKRLRVMLVEPRGNTTLIHPWDPMVEVCVHDSVGNVGINKTLAELTMDERTTLFMIK